MPLVYVIPLMGNVLVKLMLHQNLEFVMSARMDFLDWMLSKDWDVLTVSVILEVLLVLFVKKPLEIVPAKLVWKVGNVMRYHQTISCQPCTSSNMKLKMAIGKKQSFKKRTSLLYILAVFRMFLLSCKTNIISLNSSYFVFFPMARQI